MADYAAGRYDFDPRYDQGVVDVPEIERRWAASIRFRVLDTMSGWRINRWSYRTNTGHRTRRLYSIAIMTGLALPTVNAVVGQLVRDGLVEQCENHFGEVAYQLTAAGWAEWEPWHATQPQSRSTRTPWFPYRNQKRRK